jgi:hypothetical protein
MTGAVRAFEARIGGEEQGKQGEAALQQRCLGRRGGCSCLLELAVSCLQTKRNQLEHEKDQTTIVYLTASSNNYCSIQKNLMGEKGGYQKGLYMFLLTPPAVDPFNEAPWSSLTPARWSSRARQLSRSPRPGP